MSGHSKWAKLKHTKGASDAKKSKMFSRLANMITIATKQGGSADPKLNFSLRDAINKAKAENLPQDNIERAIKRGLGAGDGPLPERILFEAYGPAGTAFLIACVTDNKNRALSEIRSVLNKTGGRLGEIGSVQWLFKEQGEIAIPNATWSAHPELELALIEAGAESIQQDREEMVIETAKQNLEAARQACEQAGIDPRSEFEYVAGAPIAIHDQEIKQRIEALMDGLSDLDEVDEVYTNADF